MKTPALFIAASLALAGTPAAAQQAESPQILPRGEVRVGFPRAGTDEFPVSIAQIGIDLTLDGIPEGEISAEGPFVVERGEPRPDGGVNVIDVEIVQMELVGSSPLGPVVIRESPLRQSRGQIRALSPESDFPADSFFDVFVEIDLGEQTVFNDEPIRLQAVITEIPPRISVYRSFAQPPVIPLLARGTGQLVALLLHVAHAPNPDFEVTPRDLKILIERVQLKVELLSRKLELLTRTQTGGTTSTLLFTFNVSGVGLETGIAITNFTDRFQLPVPGPCTLELRSLADPATPLLIDTVALRAAGAGLGLDAGGSIPPGGTLSILLADLLRAGGFDARFQGTVIARCNFPAAQGINFVSDPGFSRQSQGYPAVVIR